MRERTSLSNITERYLTICLKLHHLSQKKKDAINLGMGRYSYGYRVLLERAKKERFPAPEDRAGRYKALLHFVNSGVLKELPVNPFKDALARQFCIQTARGWGKPVKDTIRFYRYSSSREYCLLYDEKKARYYAKLHVLCKEDPPFAPPERIEPARFSMVGGEIRLFSARPRYLLAPLSFGKRQWEILELARKGEAKLCTAALTRKNGEYFLNISVKLQCAAFFNSGSQWHDLHACHTRDSQGADPRLHRLVML